MRLLLPVYQRREAHDTTWTTVGIHPFTITVRGSTASRLRELLGRRLRESLKTRAGAELRPFLFAGRARLERLRVDLRLAGDKRRRFVAVVPLVVETRPCEAVLGEGDAAPASLEIAYHPQRQDEPFVLEPGGDLRRQASRFFEARGSELDDRELQALASPGRRDTLKSVPLTVKTAALLDRLPDKGQGLWDDLRLDAARGNEGRADTQKGTSSLLARLGDDLTPRAADGTLVTGRPREPLRSQLQALLCGARKRPGVLLGPPGGGKRTLLRHAVLDMLEADAYAMHRNLDEVTHVWSLSASRLIAGMSHLGEWEERCVKLAAEARKRRVVLHFEDLVALGRAGRSRDSERCMADVFRGPVERAEVVMVGTATEAQWARLEDDAPAFARLFTTLRVDPPSTTETLRMMLHASRRLAPERRVRFAPDALRAVLEIGAPLLPDQALPGAALDLLDHTARRHAGAPGPIDADLVLEALTDRTGLPEFLLERDTALTVEDVVTDLEEGVMGQTPAVRVAAELVIRVRAGLTDPKRPFGVLLFTGPTGTGKPQLAKELASYLYGASEDGLGEPERLVRFDMGELSGPDAVPRLIGERGAPRGLLTEAVRQQPFCVLLLDEIEKAHPSVLYLLLQLFEDGRLTDASGELASFTRTVVIMTSNLGAKGRPSVGFGEESTASQEADVLQAVRAFFPPELFNRIDRVVSFAPLGADAAERIARRELERLLARRGLTERNVFVSTHASAAARMAREAFDERAGARSVRRYLEAEVGAQLAEHLASRTRSEMEIVRLTASPPGAETPFRLVSEALREAEPLDARYALEGLEEASLPELRARLPAALAELDALLAGPELADVNAALGEAVSRFAAGDAEAADAAYRLDQLREELLRFRERLDGWVHDAGRQEMLHLEQAVDGRRERVIRRPPYRDPRASHPRVRLLDARATAGRLPPPDRDGILDRKPHV